MRSEVQRLLASQNGVARREDSGKPWVLSNAARAGKVIQLFPGVFVDSARRHEEDVRRRAALRYVNGRGALSHLTALAVWRLGWDEPRGARIHVTVPPAVRLRSAKGLAVHRHREFRETYRRSGMVVVSPQDAIVYSWPLLPSWPRTGIVTSAVFGGNVTIEQLRGSLANAPKLTGAAELKRVVDLVAAGCQSPLELWGALEVFTGPGMPEFIRQHPVAGYFLDLYAEDEKVAFELDGASYHAGAGHRERDVRRDARLAALGIQVVRYSYNQLTYEPDQVRREVLAILTARRRR